MKSTISYGYPYASAGIETALPVIENKSTPAWARATLGTIPFAWWGSHYGPIEVLAGQAMGAVIFGTLALVCAFWLTNALGKQGS